MHEKYAMQFLGLFYALEYVQEQYRSNTYRRTQIKYRSKIKPETARKTIPQRNLHQQTRCDIAFLSLQHLHIISDIVLNLSKSSVYKDSWNSLYVAKPDRKS